VSSVRAQANRITAPIDLARVVPLNANLRPATLRKNDRGSVEEDFPLPAMTLFFKRSAGQQADLRQLLEDQQNPGSPLYRRWLTPEMFGDRFGLSADDSAAMANWLRSQGFVVNQAARSRTWIAFSGTARQIQGAFHTEIHHYLLDGKSDFANAAEPSIPAALAEIVSGIYGLDDLSPEPVEPRMTSSDNLHTLAADDLASGLGSIDAAVLLKSWNSQPPTSPAVLASANPSPVYQQTPDAQGNQWITTITLTEAAGIGTTLTGFTINGTPTALSPTLAARPSRRSVPFRQPSSSRA
jgi:subtilase family serine protease